jgi:hypothetical protein
VIVKLVKFDGRSLPGGQAPHGGSDNQGNFIALQTL